MKTYYIVMLAITAILTLPLLASGVAKTVQNFRSGGMASAINTAAVPAVQLFSGAIISDSPLSGKITVANAAQTDASNLSTALTAYLAGSPAPDLEALLDMLFPSIPTGRHAEFMKHDDEAFLTETDDSDIREPGAAFKRIEYNGTFSSVKVKNKGLTYRADHDRLPRDGNGNLIPGWQQRYALMLRLRLIRADLLRGFGVLDAAATNLNRTWNAASNPDGDLRASVRLGHVSQGLKPNRVVIGDPAWQIRQDAYEDSTRENHAMSSHAAYNEDDLARYLGVGMVTREESLYQAKKGGSKNSFTSHVLIYNAEDNQTEDDPSNIKRFNSNTDSGGRWGVYVDERAKYTDITVEHYSQFVVPISSGIRKITVSAS